MFSSKSLFALLLLCLCGGIASGQTVYIKDFGNQEKAIVAIAIPDLHYCLNHDEFLKSVQDTLVKNPSSDLILNKDFYFNGHSLVIVPENIDSLNFAQARELQLTLSLFTNSFDSSMSQTVEVKNRAAILSQLKIRTLEQNNIPIAKETRIFTDDERKQLSQQFNELRDNLFTWFTDKALIENLTIQKNSLNEYLTMIKSNKQVLAKLSNLSGVVSELQATEREIDRVMTDMYASNNLKVAMAAYIRSQFGRARSIRSDEARVPSFSETEIQKNLASYRSNILILYPNKSDAPTVDRMVRSEEQRLRSLRPVKILDSLSLNYYEYQKIVADAAKLGVDSSVQSARTYLMLMGGLFGLREWIPDLKNYFKDPQREASIKIMLNVSFISANGIAQNTANEYMITWNISEARLADFFGTFYLSIPKVTSSESYFISIPTESLKQNLNLEKQYQQSFDQASKDLKAASARLLAIQKKLPFLPESTTYDCLHTLFNSLDHLSLVLTKSLTEPNQELAFLEYYSANPEMQVLFTPSKSVQAKIADWRKNLALLPNEHLFYGLNKAGRIAPSIAMTIDRSPSFLWQSFILPGTKLEPIVYASMDLDPKKQVSKLKPYEKIYPLRTATASNKAKPGITWVWFQREGLWQGGWLISSNIAKATYLNSPQGLVFKFSNKQVDAQSWTVKQLKLYQLGAIDYALSKDFMPLKVRASGPSNLSTNNFDSIEVLDEIASGSEIKILNRLSYTYKGLNSDWLYISYIKEAQNKFGWVPAGNVFVLDKEAQSNSQTIAKSTLTLPYAHLLVSGIPITYFTDFDDFGTIEQAPTVVADGQVLMEVDIAKDHGYVFASQSGTLAKVRVSDSQGWLSESFDRLIAGPFLLDDQKVFYAYMNQSQYWIYYADKTYGPYDGLAGIFQSSTGQGLYWYAQKQNTWSLYDMGNELVNVSEADMLSEAETPPTAHIFKMTLKEWPNAQSFMFFDQTSKEFAQLISNKGTVSVYRSANYTQNFRRVLLKPSQEAINRAKAAKLEMITVPGGQFLIGGDGQTAGLPTLISSFKMSSTEITQEQYQAIMGTNPSNFTQGPNAAKRPVEQVSWYDAVLFCNALSLKAGLNPAYSFKPIEQDPQSSQSQNASVQLIAEANGYRLPTEAQWEYAAGGGQAQNDNLLLYAGSNNIDEVAWFAGNNLEKDTTSPNYGTHPVASKKPNQLGLYDMSGNVAEWVWDWVFADGNYIPYTAGAINPTGMSTGNFKGIRGGHWASKADQSTVFFRSYIGRVRHFYFGFRVVLPIPAAND